MTLLKRLAVFVLWLFGLVLCFSTLIADKLFLLLGNVGFALYLICMFALFFVSVAYRNSLEALFRSAFDAEDK
jgi:predicted membrane channel-forming protein YqfA (hemolysin III family)